MVKINGTTIEMTRGDSVYIDLSLTYSDGTEYVPTDGDSIRFAMKRDYTSIAPKLTINIPIDTLELHIRPEDTKNLNFGKYVYDIELTNAYGDVDTFIAEATIELCKEVH